MSKVKYRNSQASKTRKKKYKSLQKIPKKNYLANRISKSIAFNDKTAFEEFYKTH